MKRPKLSPAQSKVIVELELSPLAWIGSKATGVLCLPSSYAPCVILPASGGIKGLAFSDATTRALLALGFLKHGPLTKKQLEEYRRRGGSYAPTHGYQYTGRKR